MLTLPCLSRALLCLSILLAASASGQDNVLVIVADDLGVDQLSFYGESPTPPPTPNLEALARGGIVFRNAWANPLCSPTRATMLTGRYSFRTGVGSAVPLGPPLPQEETTIPEMLRLARAGQVSTAAIGKWHLGGRPWHPTALDPNWQGFDRFSGVLAGAFAEPFDYFAWPKTVDGVTRISERYATTDNVDDALRWIGERTGPWLCWLAFNAPHTPFHAPPEHLHTQDLPSADPCSQPLPFYDAMVEALDTEVGRLLASIDPGVLQRTTVVFVGDNGTTSDVIEPPYDPERGKGTLYESGIRVPLVISGAGVVAPDRWNDDLVNTTDLFATVLELLDVDLSQTYPSDRPLDSISLVPYLREPLRPGLREDVFAEIFPRSTGGASAGGASATTPPGGESCFGGGVTPVVGQAIRNRAHKLIRYGDGREELYDLRSDPLEEHDLLASPPLDPAARWSYQALTSKLDELTSQE